MKRRAKNAAEPVCLAEMPAADEVRLVQELAEGLRIEPTDAGDLGGGAIRNVTVMAAGVAYPVSGEPFEIDAVMLQQVAEMVNAPADGIAVRVTHVESGFTAPGEGLMRLVGVCKNARVESDRVRADIHLGTYADKGPMGTAGTFLKDVASKSPRHIALSGRFRKAPYVARPNAVPLGRVAYLMNVDFVDKGGAAPDGLLAGNTAKLGGEGSPPLPPSVKETDTMFNPKQIERLVALGLKAGSDAAGASHFYETLAAADKASVDALAGTPAPAPAPANPPSPAPIQQLAGAPQPPFIDEVTRQRIGQEALAADKKRRDDITQLCKDSQLPESLAADWGNRGITLANARELAAMAVAMRPVASAHVQVGPDRNIASLSEALSDAVILRAGQPLYEFDETGELARDEQGRPKTRKPHDRALKLRHLSIVGMEQEWLSAAVGDPAQKDEIRYLGRHVIDDTCFSARRMIGMGVPVMLAMSTSDLPYLFANTVGKMLRAAYALAAITWSQWAGRGTAPDFKSQSIVALSEAPELLLTGEGGAVREAKLVEERRTIQLAKYTRKVKFTREARLADDLGGLNRMTAAFGQRARCKEDDVAYAAFLSNPTMPDTGALFNTTARTTTGGHANQAAAGGAIAVATMDAAFAAMGTVTGLQTVTDGDTGAAYLNLTPKFLHVPQAKFGTAAQFIASAVDPSKNNQTPNIYANRLTVIPNARIDANSATGWYLSADPGQVDTVLVYFLESQQTPAVRQDETWDTLDLAIACEHVVAAVCVDWRGWYRNTGA